MLGIQTGQSRRPTATEKSLIARPLVTHPPITPPPSLAPRTEKTAKGYVLDQQSNAVWGMQFFWPIKADYRVVYLDEDYEYTIIARNKKDYAWVMSRNPNISKQKRQELLDFVASLGYQIEAFSLHH